MRSTIKVILAVGFLGGVVGAAYFPVAGFFRVGPLLDPMNGLYYTARNAEHPAESSIVLPALDDPVHVYRDERGVPHIYASSDKDAVIASGYVTAQDRLFQMDYVPRVASGRLSEVFGPAAVEADRFLRSTGMDLGARRNYERVAKEQGVENTLVNWYAEGVNALVSSLEEHELPLEFRLFGYRPGHFRGIDAMRVLQFMVFDLTYRDDDLDYRTLVDAMGKQRFEELYPTESEFAVPIVTPASRQRQSTSFSAADGLPPGNERAFPFGGTDGFRPGKGSNNWAISARRSTTDAPVLAGDMHLRLTLPAIWYEMHLVTPNMNVYGVTIPGAPVLVEAFNDRIGWTYTNSGTDLIDQVPVQLSSDSTRIAWKGGSGSLETIVESIEVRGEDTVSDTMFVSELGMVTLDNGQPYATHWVALKPNRILRALWGMLHAENRTAFEAATRYFDAPMQNILYADVDGHIAIRSTGFLPNGSSDRRDWSEGVPFVELPAAVDPERGYLTSTNQPPSDGSYPHFLGSDWRAIYRSVRIDDLLSSKPKHSLDDLQGYQSDIFSVEADLFVPLLGEISFDEGAVDSLRLTLLHWDRHMDADAAEPLLFDAWMNALEILVWDEPVFDGLIRPHSSNLFRLIRDNPNADWFDILGTQVVESAEDVLRASFERAVPQFQTLGEEAPTWGRYHQLKIDHLTRSGVLAPLSRGPFAFGGDEETLSPGGGRIVTASASWRVVVDFSTVPPRGRGIYPGGQSGNPFSQHYDNFVSDYLAFSYYELLKPSDPLQLVSKPRVTALSLSPR